MNLKQLSEKLGLSPTTVSRGLNGYPEVSEATRSRIQAAAKKYNYSPSTRAKSLATGRSMAIGHVVPTSGKTEMVNPIFADFIAGAGETYAAAGYDMILSMVPPEAELATYRDLVARQAVDGVIVHAPRVGDERVSFLRKLKLPFVFHGRAPEQDAEYAWLDINNTRAFARATRLLIDLGHRDIAFLNGDESMEFARRRRSGFEEEMALAKLPVRRELTKSVEMTESIGFEAAHGMLSGPNPPTAFLVSSIIMAIGVRRAIEKHGLVMGRDISVVTHDDEISYLKNGEAEPVFTATRSSVRDAGRRAAELLLQQITASDTRAPHELWECDLVLGASTGPAPAPR